MTEEIAFDLRAAGGSPTGVGRHLLSIVRALAECRPDLQLRVYVRDDVPDLPAGVRVVRVRSRGPLWHARVWWHLRRRPVRAYCSTSLIVPCLPGVPALPIVLDVISFLYPEYLTRRTTLAEKLLMGRALKRHPAIAGSFTTKRDIERVFPACRVSVVAPWVDLPPPSAGDASSIGRVRERFGIRQPYALYVGTIEPRKNVLTVVRAVQELRRRGTDAQLALVGGRGWVPDEVVAELREAQSSGAVVWTGYLPDADRDAFLAGAACLLMPSVYEGFGLPLLEALARGLPCICSSAPSFLEVAGDAAVHVETFDVTGWADAVADLLADPSLQRTLIEAGHAAAARYTSGATAVQFGEALATLG